jgi:hypothetical protein
MNKAFCSDADIEKVRAQHEHISSLENGYMVVSLFSFLSVKVNCSNSIQFSQSANGDEL